MKNGSQQIPNITTTDVIILMDFFFLAIKFKSLPSSLLPGIKDTKYKGHPCLLSIYTGILGIFDVLQFDFFPSFNQLG